MENYIINNKTVALLKKDKKTIIYDVDNIRVINKSITKILESNCNFYGNTLKSSKKCAQMILKVKYKVPILINNQIILMQLSNYRDKECLFIVFNKVLDFEEVDNLLIIECINNLKFSTFISQFSFEKSLINSLKLFNIINWRNNKNIV